MTDDLELQEQIKSGALAKPKSPSAASAAALIAAWSSSPSILSSSKKKPEVSSEYSQWVVLPSGKFQATGDSIDYLPSGAYDLELTDSGLHFVSKKIMTDALVDFDDSNSIKVIKGIQLFWTRKQKYVEREIVYKRGILMWGPPGSGKTATLSLMMVDLIKQDGIILMVQNPALVVRALRQFRQIEPNRPLIIVLEDVEEIISQHGEHELLALLDGEHQTDNVVCIATTNYPEQLGARIVNRPSRFDEVVKIGMPSEKMRKQYLKHALREEKEEYPVEKWVKDTDGMSVAHLKELVVAITCLDQDYDKVIARLKTMKTTPKSGSPEDGFGFTRV